MSALGGKKSVVITSENGTLAARLNEGLVLRHEDAIALADLLVAHGVRAEDVCMPDWREGDIAPSNGQKIAILGRMHNTERAR